MTLGPSIRLTLLAGALAGASLLGGCAPLLLGGRASRPAFGGPDPARLAQAARLTPRSPLLGLRGQALSPAAPADGAYELWYPAGRAR